MPVSRRYSQRCRRAVLWCLRGRDFFAPAVARIGLHPDRVIYCETWNDRDVLPVMEEGLKCRGLAAVVGEATRGNPFKAEPAAKVLQQHGFAVKRDRDDARTAAYSRQRR